MITISNLHEWIDKHSPDCSERRLLHLLLERLAVFEAGQVPELKGKLVESGGNVFVAGDSPE
jgi:hypothetical protein